MARINRFKPWKYFGLPEFRGNKNPPKLFIMNFPFQDWFPQKSGKNQCSRWNIVFKTIRTYSDFDWKLDDYIPLRNYLPKLAFIGGLFPSDRIVVINKFFLAALVGLLVFVANPPVSRGLVRPNIFSLDEKLGKTHSVFRVHFD